MKQIPAQKVEFYSRGGGMITALRAYAVPREGECININNISYRVAYVQWSLDTGFPWGDELRANVELEQISPSDVGPSSKAQEGE